MDNFTAYNNKRLEICIDILILILKLATQIIVRGYLHLESLDLLQVGRSLLGAREYIMGILYAIM